MNDDTARGVGRSIAKVLAASLVLALAAASAKPPTVNSAATGFAIDAYQACLVQGLGKRPASATLQSVSEATRACAREEAIASAAVLRENPDRPLFAQSYVQTLKEAAVDQAGGGTAMAVTLAQQARP